MMSILKKFFLDKYLNFGAFALNPYKVSINIKALNTGFTLYTISSVPEQLVHVQIASPASGNPDIEFDEAAMQQLSEYLDANSGVEAFQQVFAVGKIEDIGGGNFSNLSITDFYPDTITGGTGDTLIIIGTGFGQTRDDSRVKFKNAKEGPNSSIEWVACIDSSYVLWSDTLIKVVVDGGGYENNSNTITNDIYPGTGPIRIVQGAFNIPYTTSSTDLFIPYCLTNQVFSNTKESIPIALENNNGQGGYDLFYINELRRDTLAREAFERALATWRCSTRVNFRIVDSTQVSPTNYQCSVSYLAIPISTSTTTLAQTQLTIQSNCSAGGAFFDLSLRREFKIYFNSNVNWHRKDTMPTTLPNNTYDFESRALHEIGHALLLVHSNNPNDLMYFTDLTPPYRRQLEINDIDGGTHACQFSSSQLPQSCHNSMILINLADCDSLTNTIRLSRNLDLEVNIYPNPTSQSVQINIKNIEKLSGQKKLVLSTITGQVLHFDNNVNDDNSIDISMFPRGIYILTLTVDGISQSYKILKYE
jgi:hypothetical protein